MSAKEITKKNIKAVPKVKAPKKEDGVSKLRIRVRAYDSKILDASVKQIIETFNSFPFRRI